MNPQKHALSARAISWWLCAAACGVAGFVLPSIVAAIAEKQSRDQAAYVNGYAAYSETDVGDHSLVDLAYLMALAIPWGAGLYFGAAGQNAQKSYDIQVMTQRSLSAQHDILEAIRAEASPPPFFLYLRPFYSDALSIQNPRLVSLSFLPAHYYAPTVSWESVFTERVETYGRVVSLGTPSESLSADRIESTDAEWMLTFVALASFADCIFVWPSTRTGTRWEIEWLLREHFSRKTVFVVPRGYDKIVELYGDSWDYVRAFLLFVGLDPPTERGVIFHASKTGSLKRPLRLTRRYAKRVVGEFISAAPREDFTTRSEVFRNARASLEQAPPSFDVDEFSVFFPCVECGRALTAVVCATCEDATDQVMAEQDFGLQPLDQTIYPTFDSLGRVHWPVQVS